MDFDGWVYIAAGVWFLLSLLNKARTARDREPPAPEPSPNPLSRSPGRDPRPDATQREGSRLEQVLRELERSLEQAGSTSRPVRLPLPEAEEVEDRESLESEPQVMSLEQDVRRAARQEFTQDAGVEELVAKRIKAASARDSARTKVDHVKFDSQIRQEPADHTATRGYTAEELRRAVVWREILGPPISLRGEEGEK
jgi:hypothetical protein